MNNVFTICSWYLVTMRDCLVRYMKETGVKVITGAKVSEIQADAVSFVNADGQTESIPAATVVTAFGYKAYNPLEEAARKYCQEVYVVGGAVKAGNALTAVKEGYDAALAL